MTLEYKKQTDQEHKETLASQIVNAEWGQKLAAVGDKVRFLVQTHFVGNGSDIEIEVEDKKGKKVEKLKGQVFADQFMGTFVVPDKAKEEVTFTAKLSKHGLTMKSGPMIVFFLKATNMKWGQKEARRGDLVKISADIDGLPDETEVMLFIYEYDRDDAHDFITRFPCRVKNKKIQAEWEYEYNKDTDEIPTDEEMKKHGKKYNPPEYFFVIDFRGKRSGEKQESGLLEFRDWVEIELKDEEGNVIANQDYVITFADGSEKKDKLDSTGKAKYEQVPPGKIVITIPGTESVEMAKS